MPAIRYPLSFNQITAKTKWTLRQAIEGCARHGVTGIAPWRDKLAECGVISPEDLDLFHYVSSPEEGFEYLKSRLTRLIDDVNGMIDED